MFQVDESTGKITMHRGDTGSMTFTFTGYDWTQDDFRALFSMKKDSQTVKEQITRIPSSGMVTVTFANEDTDYLTPGTYEYDVRIVRNPTFDNDGKLTSGTFVRTPWDPVPVEIKRTVGLI